MRKHTKIILTTCISVVSFLTLGCNHVGESDKQAADTAQNDSSVLNIGTLSQSISYYEKGEKIMGYEYEMAQDFAKSLNRKINFIIGKDVNDLANKVANGEVDVVAYPIVMSNEHRQKLLFTNHTYITHQVLVQRKEEKKIAIKGKRKKKEKTITQKEINDVTQLIGKEVWVLAGSKHEERLKNLNEEIGGGIVIKTCGEEEDEEDLIDRVSKKEIDFTICDEKVAKANTSEYNNIDLSLNVSFDQRSAWVVKDTILLNAVNRWEEKVQTQKLVRTLHMKYFDTKKYVAANNHRIRITKIPKGSHEISNYDPYYKKFGAQYGFDWRLIAAITHKESRFYPDVIGWSGSIGLMQLMPNTARKMGAKSREDLFDPEVNIKIGCKCLKVMFDSYKSIPNTDDRIRFTLASYNAGVGHIKDAQALAKKYGKDPLIWKDNVETYVRLKSNRQYFTDPVVKHGYMSGNNVCNYVATIMAQYEEYKEKFSND